MKFEKYRDAKGEWRWRLRRSNGKILADSAEGYKDERDCDHGIELVQYEAPCATIETREA